MDISAVFQFYRKYAELVRLKVEEQGYEPIKDALCEDEFARVWKLLPKSQKEHWERRLKAGFEQIILSESSQYASILSSDDSAAVKAA